MVNNVHGILYIEWKTLFMVHSALSYEHNTIFIISCQEDKYKYTNTNTWRNTQIQQDQRSQDRSIQLWPNCSVNFYTEQQKPFSWFFFVYFFTKGHHKPCAGRLKLKVITYLMLRGVLFVNCFNSFLELPDIRRKRPIAKITFLSNEDFVDHWAEDKAQGFPCLLEKRKPLETTSTFIHLCHLLAAPQAQRL